MPDAHIALVVAHPDDETLACGLLLQRVSPHLIIHVTDGAPRSENHAQERGFRDARDYAAARRREWRDAARLTNVPPEAMIDLAVADQDAAFHLADLALRLRSFLGAMNIVLTHAYEGGHPDHDAVAFAVHATCRLAPQGSAGCDIVEMPFYRAGAEDWVRQSFAAAHAPETVIVASPEERRIKKRMLAAFASQRETVSCFNVHEERFRRAPDYDFRQLPNEGALLYERYEWGMTGALWQELVNSALTELGLDQDRWR